MVKILSYIAGLFFLLVSLTLYYYDKTEIKNTCGVRMLTSSSFYAGLGEDLKGLYFKKYKCQLKFDVVNGANLISNLFIKQPSRYDVLVGLDQFQIDKLDSKLLWNLEALNLSDSITKNNYYIAYDEAPITFFLREPIMKEFKDLISFFEFAKNNKISIAVPLKTTSVLGAVFDLWLTQNNSLEIKKLPQIKYVKSWSESFGLFERKIVDGFLSFETSEIYYLNNLKIKKVIIQKGHPNLKEYFAFSKEARISLKQKSEFADFINSKEVQSLILEKNYMWPAYDLDHKNKNLRNLKLIELDSHNSFETVN